MKILVTGGAGFIGANFVRQTLAERPGTRITVLDKLTYAGDVRSLEDVWQRIEFVRGDVTDSDLVDGLVAGCDLVVHFAAESHNEWALAEDAGGFVQTNVMGTYSLLEAVRRHGVRFHHVSTDEVYGDLGLGGDARFTAGSPMDPSTPYAASKGGGDLLVQAWIRSFGVAATISRCCNNYGPYQHVEKLIPRQITNVLDGHRPELFGDGAHVRDWINVRDHNSAVWAVIERGRIGETYLIGADCQASNRRVVETILELMGHEPDDYDRVGDRICDDRRYAIDASKLREHTGWRPQVTDFRAGLAATIDWYRGHESWWRAKKAPTEARYQANRADHLGHPLPSQ